MLLCHHTSTIIIISSTLVLLLLRLAPVKALKIKNLWTPDVIENGTQNSALVDCDFIYDQQDVQSLELKWYFRHDPQPIYSWVPPNKPQVAEAFKQHINLDYVISSDPYLKHRALNLVGISTKLSGRYSCRVSSIHTDEFESKDLIIYSPARKTTLAIGWVNSRLLNITCEALQIYPEPSIKINIHHPTFKNESIDISDEASRSVIWSQGTFSSIVSKTLDIQETMLSTESSITCTFTLNKTPYHEVRWQRIPRPPKEFFRPASPPMMNSSEGHLLNFEMLASLLIFLWKVS